MFISPVNTFRRRRRKAHVIQVIAGRLYAVWIEMSSWVMESVLPGRVWFLTIFG